MSGLSWKRNLEETLERRRRFFGRKMQDGILASIWCVELGKKEEWEAFDRKWGTYKVGEPRPFPSNEEIFERVTIGLEKFGQVEDDELPVVYSTIDADSSRVPGLFGREMKFIHQPHGPAIAVTERMLEDYAELGQLHFSMEDYWPKRTLEIQEYFAEHAGDGFSQHPCMTSDALNFACEARGFEMAYLDLYEHPDELRQLMEIALDFNIRFQEAQMKRTGTFRGGSFSWLAGWMPFPKTVLMSVDAYTSCSVESYIEFGFEYQRRLIEHFGHGVMHFHCNRTDLAAEVAKLPGLELIQYGGDPKSPKPEIAYLEEMRKAVGEVPVMVSSCPLAVFRERLEKKTLPPNVWYSVYGGGQPYISIDEANELAEKAKRYRV